MSFCFLHKLRPIQYAREARLRTAVMAYRSIAQSAKRATSSWFLGAATACPEIHKKAINKSTWGAAIISQGSRGYGHLEGSAQMGKTSCSLNHPGPAGTQSTTSKHPQS
ncbi:hypothetical protein E2C01_012100 [Portunus trituberculatus]|uniref:Uncharacterized protein n=1 Tax=Portunus trituberculatus TaxID=210409 RepID=A0A5B7DCY5_PORTR|nr:hypothetical protein [Portunus trituberculatus]